MTSTSTVAEPVGRLLTCRGMPSLLQPFERGMGGWQIGCQSSRACCRAFIICQPAGGQHVGLASHTSCDAPEALRLLQAPFCVVTCKTGHL